MKTKLFLALLLPMILSACGKDDPVAPPPPTAAGTCAQGQVLGQTGGCLVPYNGMPGFGQLNGQPVQASCWANTVMTAQGCWPPEIAANYNSNPNYAYNPNNPYPQQQQQPQCRRWEYSPYYGPICTLY